MVFHSFFCLRYSLRWRRLGLGGFDGARRSNRRGAAAFHGAMYSAPGGKGRNDGGALSPRSARARMEEALGKLDISEEETTPLVIDDSDDGSPSKWLLAGKVLFKNLFHIQTITNALRPAWGNPRGLSFRPLGENMFAAEFASKRDRDRVWDGSP